MLILFGGLIYYVLKTVCSFYLKLSKREEVVMGLFGSDIEMTIEHGQSPDEVIRRLTADLEARLQTAYPDGGIGNLTQSWSGGRGSFSCTAGGHSLSGEMTVGASSLYIKVELPAFAGLAIDTDGLKSSVSKQIRDLLK
ncbi:hypothetical protein ACFL0L_02485 [Patescibacteria group bacterium]